MMTDFAERPQGRLQLLSTLTDRFADSDVAFGSFSTSSTVAASSRFSGAPRKPTLNQRLGLRRDVPIGDLSRCSNVPGQNCATRSPRRRARAPLEVRRFRAPALFEC